MIARTDHTPVLTFTKGAKAYLGRLGSRHPERQSFGLLLAATKPSGKPTIVSVLPLGHAPLGQAMSPDPAMVEEALRCAEEVFTPFGLSVVGCWAACAATPVAPLLWRDFPHPGALPFLITHGTDDLMAWAWRGSEWAPCAMERAGEEPRAPIPSIQSIRRIWGRVWQPLKDVRVPYWPEVPRIQVENLPEIPGYRLMETAVPHWVRELRGPKGELLWRRKGPIKALHVPHPLRADGTTALDRYRTLSGRWITLRVQEFGWAKGKEPISALGPRPWISVWRKNFIGPEREPLDFVPPGSDVSHLTLRFEAWWQVWRDAFKSPVRIRKGWIEWCEQGLRLCRELMVSMGPEAVLQYREATRTRLKQYGCTASGLYLYWEPKPGEEAVMLRKLLSDPEP